MVTIDAEFECYADLLQAPYDVTADDLKKRTKAGWSVFIRTTETLLQRSSRVETASIGDENAILDEEKQASVSGHRQQELRAFRCHHCEKAFTRKHNLERHVRCHTGEKPFVCSVCQKAFRQNPELVAHRRVHTGEKPYKCSECNKSFARQQKLRLHEAAYHSGERRYECNDCPAAFVQLSQLKMHRKVHSSGAPILDCAHCGRCFTQKNAHMAHFKKCQVVWF
ncbi:hypothetical protein AAVH_11511 [Aphelenchoides avenae]|nr:hypothetical protein AAVH_11511 [Aphelenchus avenae]